MTGPSALAADPSRLEFGPPSNMCLEIYGFSKIEGAGLSMWECKTSGDLRNQQWFFDPAGIFNGRQYYRIRNKHSQLCVNIEGQSQLSGARVIQWGCNLWDPNAFNMYFAFIPSGSFYKLQALHSGKCLTATALARRAPVVQDDCNKAPRDVVNVRS
jgi:hypothetical protein